MTVSATVDARALLKRAQELGATKIPQAVGAALGRAGRAARVAASKRIRETWVVPAGVLRTAITIESPRGSDIVRGAEPVAILRAKGGPIPLRDFGAKMTNRGVTFRVERGGPRKIYKAKGRTGFKVGRREGERNKRGRRTGKFIENPDFGGHAYVSARGRRAIYKLHGPGIAQRVAGRDVRSVIKTTFSRQFEVEFRRALQQRIRVATGG